MLKNTNSFGLVLLGRISLHNLDFKNQIEFSNFADQTKK